MRRRILMILLLLLILLIPIFVLARLPLWLILLLVLLLLLLLLLYLALSEWLGGRRFRPEEFYVQDQVVLSGPLASIRPLIAGLQGVTLTRMDRLTFGDLDPDLLNCLAPFYDLRSDDFVVDLYQIEGTSPDVKRAIDAIRRAAGPGSDVTAEPNWISASPWQVGGSPWQVGGSPWQVGGSPWQVGGSPWQVGGSTATGEAQKAAPTLYTDQWLLRAIDMPVERPFLGRGVRVGVLDTSPFPLNQIPLGSQATQPVSWVPRPLPLGLDVSHPQPSAVLPPDPKAPDVGNHGLFSVGMVHLVAPGSDIHLVRVLNDDNRGDLYTLMRAIFDFLGTRNDEPWLGHVLNLSLGIRIPPEAAGFELPTALQSLRDMLTAARCLGVVVVAAAGNNSADLETPEPPHLPANLSTVIGVAASGVEDGRSCFSNRGDLAAPGGNGSGEQTERNCRPRLDQCDGEYDCAYAVVGPVYDADGEMQYIYWMGSSFAAPQVAGLAALVVEAGQGQLSPAQVRAIIECGAENLHDDAHLGEGVVKVGQTFARFAECLRELGVELPPGEEKVPHPEQYQDELSPEDESAA